jgi:hypothetical protein
MPQLPLLVNPAHADGDGHQDSDPHHDAPDHVSERPESDAGNHPSPCGPPVTEPTDEQGHFSSLLIRPATPTLQWSNEAPDAAPSAVAPKAQANLHGLGRDQSVAPRPRPTRRHLRRVPPVIFLSRADGPRFPRTAAGRGVTLHCSPSRKPPPSTASKRRTRPDRSSRPATDAARRRRRPPTPSTRQRPSWSPTASRFAPCKRSAAGVPCGWWSGR